MMRTMVQSHPGLFNRSSSVQKGFGQVQAGVARTSTRTQSALVAEPVRADINRSSSVQKGFGQVQAGVARTNTRTQSTVVAEQVHQEKADIMVFGASRNQHGPSTRRIICYGDSNTCGLHISTSGRGFRPYGQSLAAELALRGVPCEIVVCGLCGHTTEDMLGDKDLDYVQPRGYNGHPVGPSGKGLKRMLEELGPVDLVVIMTGTNDIGSAGRKGVGFGSIVQSIKQLHALCHDMGVPTVVLAPTATMSMSSPLRALRQAVCDSLVGFAASSPNVLACLDVEDLLPGKGGKSNCPGATGNWEQDGLHITCAGSGVLGRRLAPYAAQWLEGVYSTPRTPSPLRLKSAETDSARDEHPLTPSEKRTMGYFAGGSEQAALKTEC